MCTSAIYQHINIIPYAVLNMYPWLNTYSPIQPWHNISTALRHTYCTCVTDHATQH